MSVLSFCAWGTINLETMERFQRRQIIRQFRRDIEPHGLELHVGGGAQNPNYCLMVSKEHSDRLKVVTVAGDRILLPFASHKLQDIAKAAIGIIEHGGIK